MGHIIGHFTYNKGVSAIDAALDADALFTPKVTGTLLPNGQTDTDTFTLYREFADGTMSVLNAGVSGRFYDGSYRSICEIADAMFPNSVRNLKLIDNGKVLVFVQELEESGYTFADGDRLTTNLMYTASMDSSYKSQIVGFIGRPFCTNQIPLGQLQVSQKRTKNHDELMFSKALVLSKLSERFDTFVRNATLLKMLPLTATLKRRILDEVAPLAPEGAATKTVNHRERIRAAIEYHLADEIDTWGNNAHALMQAVQSTEFHDLTAGKAQEVKRLDVLTKPEQAQSMTIQTVAMLRQEAANQGHVLVGV